MTLDKKPFRTTRHLVNLRQGRNDWYKIIKAKADEPTQVMIYDEIGYFGVTAQDFVRDLADVKGDVELHLATPGGEVFDGLAIYAALKQRGGISVVVDSLAASIGSVIAMAADPGKLLVAKNASLMIHDGFGLAIGNAADMRQMADLLDKTSDNIASIYAERTGRPTAQWRDAMLAETWYVGQEAVDAGLADSVQGAKPADPAPVATWDLSVFARRPGGTPPDPPPAAAAGPGDSADLSWIDQLDLTAFEEATK